MLLHYIMLCIGALQTGTYTAVCTCQIVKMNTNHVKRGHQAPVITVRLVCMSEITVRGPVVCVTMYFWMR